jgi:ribosomal protein L9
MLKTIILKNFASKKKYKIGSTIPLNRGYARYLIREKYVLPANKNTQMIIQKLLSEEEIKKDTKILQANDIKTKLEKENITFIITNCNRNGILFGSISLKDIIRNLHKVNPLYTSINANNLKLEKMIKIYGIYACNVFLYNNIEANFYIYVGNSQENINKMITQNILDHKENTENILVSQNILKTKEETIIKDTIKND